MPTIAARYRKDMESMNCGFRQSGDPPGNVRLPQVQIFRRPGSVRPTAVAAMNFLANVDAIIFDLRENGAAIPQMIRVYPPPTCFFRSLPT